MKAVVVVPTYNEKENIGILIPKLQKIFKKIKHDMHILVVDDSSPDGTAKEVKKLKKKYSNLHLLTGKKQGLGIAYIRGFDYAVSKLKADVFFENDADLSHPPELIPKFMEEIDNGYDLVIGSRYIKGGNTPDWPWNRKLISWGGNIFARIISGMYNVHDCTSGFRAIRTKIYKKIKKQYLHTRGYAFQSTFLYELMTHGAKVKEIPLVFHDRKYGTTKLQKKDVIEFFFNAFRLRLKSSKRMIKFAIVGGSGIVVNLGILFLLVEKLGLDKKLIGPAIAIEISIIWNFIANNAWTFKHSKNNNSYLSKMLKFHIIAFSGMIINLLIYNAILHFGTLTKITGTYDYLVAQFIAICIAFIWNYLVNVKWTWREKI